MILQRESQTCSTDPSPSPILVRKTQSETVQVVVRCRPMSLKERTQGHTQIVDMWPQQGVVYIRNPKRNTSCHIGNAGKTFAFDSVFDWNANQDDLYKRTVQPLVYSVLDGFNGTIFAYGQTGTGKTYTMLGSRGNPKEKGIIAKCFEEIFAHISHNNKHTSYIVRASYLEIYQEETRDLLSQDIEKKPLREDTVRGIYVKGLQSVVCKNLKAIQKVMRVGNMNRATAATNMNEHSSRSHAIFQITVEMQDRASKEAGLRRGLRVGKLNLVDLAGSERQCKTGAVGERLKESGKINLSLSALGNVISALVNGKSSHIPYRDSKLTQILQDSLGGNSKSIMIANIGPASYNYDESLMTLRYASRAKRIRNHPVRNVDDMNSIFCRCTEEMKALKRLMIDQDRADTSSSNISRGMTSSSVTDESQPVSPSSTEEPPTRTETGAGDATIANCFKLKKSKSRVDEIRKRRTQRRVVWRLRGKYHQETTVKMVKWLQEQMAQSSEGSEPPPNDTEPAPQKARQPSLTESELSTQQLIDDLSYIVRRKGMLTSIAQLTEEARRRKKQVRALMQLAVEMNEMRQRTEQQHEQERQAALNEKRRLLRELALRSVVFRSYFADGDHRRVKSCCCCGCHIADHHIVDHHIVEHHCANDKLSQLPAPAQTMYRASSYRATPGGDADTAFSMLAASAH